MILTAANATLLVIDDEPFNLRLALDALRGHGLEVVCAEDGATGLGLARRLRPDLILLDIRMPGLDGFAVCRHLQADPATRDFPVIFLSVKDEIEDKAQGFAVGAVDYITRPFDVRELVLRVANQLRLARRIGAREQGQRASPTTAPPPDRPLECLMEARNLLLADLAHPPDLETLARHCATNRNSLEDLFRTHFGLTVFSYLREQRLQRGRHLLEQDHQTVAAAAAAVGYSSAHEFARAFKQRFGIAPGALPRRTDPTV